MCRSSTTLRSRRELTHAGRAVKRACQKSEESASKRLKARELYGPTSPRLRCDGRKMLEQHSQLSVGQFPLSGKPIFQIVAILAATFEIQLERSLRDLFCCWHFRPAHDGFSSPVHLTA